MASPRHAIYRWSVIITRIDRQKIIFIYLLLNASQRQWRSSTIVAYFSFFCPSGTWSPDLTLSWGLAIKINKNIRDAPQPSNLRAKVRAESLEPGREDGAFGMNDVA